MRLGGSQDGHPHPPLPSHLAFLVSVEGWRQAGAEQLKVKMLAKKVLRNLRPPADDPKLRTPWLSICCTGSVAFCIAVQFSLFFSSMWPYMQLVSE